MMGEKFLKFPPTRTKFVEKSFEINIRLLGWYKFPPEKLDLKNSPKSRLYIIKYDKIGTLLLKKSICLLQLIKINKILGCYPFYF